MENITLDLPQRSFDKGYQVCIEPEDDVVNFAYGWTSLCRVGITPSKR